MFLRDISLSIPEENILFDDVLLYLAEQSQGEETLRFWESKELFIVLGRLSSLEEDIDLKEIEANRIRVLRRSSGGGTVLQGRGCLNYSLILNKNSHPGLFDLRKSYEYILGKVKTALDACGIRAAFHPISDIALKDHQKKISGNAQKRGRHFILHHGTILYDFDLTLITRYLKMPKQIPDYRNKRAHTDFVSNAALDPTKFKEQLAKDFSADKICNQISEKERQVLNEFMLRKNVAVEISSLGQHAHAR